MRIALVNPPHRSGDIYMKEIGRCGRRSAAGEVWPQTGLATVAAVLKERGHEVLLHDGMALGEDFGRCIGRILRFQPGLCVIHTVTPTYNSDMEFCGEIKATLPGVPIALLGTHAAALGAESIRNQPAEIAVAEEAEIPLTALADALNPDPEGSWNPNRAKGIPGLWIKVSESEIVSGGPGPLVEDLNELPLPFREGLPNERYQMPFFGGEPFATVIPSRGCPWNCTFCRSGITWGDRVRARSPENVVAEIIDLRTRHGIRCLAFMTDTFTYDKPWVLKLCGLIREHIPDLRWVCNSRVDTIDRERLAAMKAAGCLVISYGVESADPEILAGSRKGITPESAEEAIRLTRESGITSFAYFILGLPGETRTTIEKTIRFALRIDPDYAFFHVAIPFPGTELYETARKNGWLETEDWDRYEENGGGVMRTEHLSSDDLRKAQSAAHRRFFLRPSRLFRELFSIRHLSDLLSKARAGINLFAGHKES